MAERFTQRINHQTFLGQDSMVLPYDEALAMALDLIKMSERFHELHKSDDEPKTGRFPITGR